jgi:hypothetical protein
MRSTAIAVTCGLLMLGCSEESPLVPQESLVVLQAYLYVDRPIRDIRLTSTLSLDAEGEVAPPINDAKVTLTKDAARYSLPPSAGDSGYYHYDGVDLTVKPGDRFTIEVECFGKTATGTTVVPSAPKDLGISSDTLAVPDFSNISPGNFPDFRSAQLRVHWSNPDASYYYLVIENVDANPEQIESSFPTSPMRIITQPTARDSLIVSAFTLTHYGRHRVTLYRVNQEYVDLYESRQQDSRNLNEPLTNIKNGVGIFTAFNSDSVFFYARKE